MDERNKELERIQKELLAQEDTIPLEELSVDDILADEELGALLSEKKEPAFEDPDQICDPEGEMRYNNFANDYGKNTEADGDEEDEALRAARNEKIQIGLMIAACALCLGIIGILIYWINMFS